MDQYFNGADSHRMVRRFDFANIELNGVATHDCDPTCGQIAWIYGIRYFKFEADIHFATSTGIGSVSPFDAAYDVNLENHLVGVQLGALYQRPIRPGLGMTATFKGGLYNNHLEHHSRLGSSAEPAVIDGGPDDGEPFEINNSRNHVAFLSEADIGFEGCWHGWTVTATYRAVVATNVGIVTDQIASDFTRIAPNQQISARDQIFLHGGYVGAAYMW